MRLVRSACIIPLVADTNMTVAAKTTHKIPSGLCYACDKECTGVTMHNGAVKGACKRHMDSTLKASFFCMYCDGALRNGSLNLGQGIHAHAKC